MSDSTNPLNEVSSAAIEREVTINENFAQTSPASIFAYDSVTSAALTWGYMGGRLDGTSFASGTVSLTASNTNYVVAHRTTLAVTVSTANTNWNNTTTYGRLYLVVAGASTVTSYQDHRAGGIFAGGSGGGGAPSGAAGGHLGGTYPNPTLSATGIAAATTLTEAPADLAYTGITVSMTYGEAIVAGAPLYFKSDGTVCNADANAAGKFPAMGLAMETASSGSHVVLLFGIYRNDSLYSFSLGGSAGLVYLSTAAGAVTQTQPSATDDCIQILGFASHADRFFFNPQLNYLTHV